jgi:hypothetical protein
MILGHVLEGKEKWFAKPGPQTKGVSSGALKQRPLHEGGAYF